MTKRHKWTSEDEEKLEEAVVFLLGQRQHFRGPRDVFWAAVVGRSGVDVTPGAARSRWELISKRNSEKVDGDGWELVEKTVEEYERSLAEDAFRATMEVKIATDETQKRLRELQLATAELRGLVDDIKHALSSVQGEVSRLVEVWK